MQNDNEEIQQQNSMRLQYLTARHQELDDQVDEMDKQATLLPSEVMKLKLLKVLRLQAKEAVDKFKREQEAGEV